MFATIKSLIPEPRQADQPRRYVGRHRAPEPPTAEIPARPEPAAAEPATVEPATVEAATVEPAEKTQTAAA
jgi:hypothetical protein